MTKIAGGAAKLIAAVSLAATVTLAPASSDAQECSAGSDAIGTGRVIAVDPAALRRVGTLQFPQTLPLKDHEVVLSFDDGPSAATTPQVLDALAAECVEAGFFMVGEHAKAEPALVRRALQAGHAVGTHTQTHAALAEIPLNAAKREIQDGIESVNAALGGQWAAAPFFRAPYLATTPAIDQYLADSDLMLWSADVDPEDWRPLTADDVVARILSRLAIKRSGIILMHDVQAHTAAALPQLLRELKARHYSIAHIVAGKTEAAAH